MASQKLLTKAEAEKALRERVWAGDPLKRLPEDVDAQLAADVVLESFASRVWGFARRCQQIPPSVIREVLRRLDAEQAADPIKVFLREYVRVSQGRPVREVWKEALLALLDLDSEYAWGSKQKKAKFSALAARPSIVAAMQAAVVVTAKPPLAMLAVLAAEGGETSADALLSIFAQGGVADTRLTHLETHAAKTPAMAALLESAESRAVAKSKASPAIAFAKEHLGLELDALSVHVTVNSVELNRNHVPRFQGSFDIDSSWDQFWAVSITEVVSSGTRFPGTYVRMGDVVRDELKLGVCQLVEAPRWLAAAAKKLGVTWNVSVSRSSLRGKKRELVVAWLGSTSRNVDGDDVG